MVPLGNCHLVVPTTAPLTLLKVSYVPQIHTALFSLSFCLFVCLFSCGRNLSVRAFLWACVELGIFSVGLVRQYAINGRTSTQMRNLWES